jgi:hypothetical protein
MKKYQEDAVKEQRELKRKIAKFLHFIELSQHFARLDLAQQDLIRQQLATMQQYARILAERIAIFKEKEKYQ